MHAHQPHPLTPHLTPRIQPRTNSAARSLPVTLRAIALLAAALGLVAQTAAAHDQLLSSSPADGATTDSMPTKIELVLSEAPLAAGAPLLLTTPDGNTLTAGPPDVDTTRGAAIFPVTGDSPPGTYTAAWHVVSSDGHPIEGTFEFTVEGDQTPVESTPSPVTTGGNPSPSAMASGASPTPSVTPSATESPAVSATGTDDQGTLNPLAVTAGIVAAAVAVLVLVTFITRRRDSLREPDGSPPGGPANGTDDTDRAE